MGRGGNRNKEMARVFEAMDSVLQKSTNGNLADAVDRELAERGLLKDTGRNGGEPERCGGCGGLKREADHENNRDRVCRCGGRKRRLLSYLAAADPARRMTLDTLNASDPTVSVALAAARDIVAGSRNRGMLLMGLPGRGKSHLMVGLGRALLDGDRDAGYYNVVRLVSQIQDSYSDFEGETRRAIVESVASHEVVLLDDLGKEHASTNVESIIYELVDTLYAARIVLVVSTNVPATGGDGYGGPNLYDRYDEAVRSRLKAMCERFVVKGEDRRLVPWGW